MPANISDSDLECVRAKWQPLVMGSPATACACMFGSDPWSERRPHIALAEQPTSKCAEDIALGFNAQRESCTRIARDLHDTLLQIFHRLLMRFHAARDLRSGRSADAADWASACDDAAQAITRAHDAFQCHRSSAAVTNDLANAPQILGEELAAFQTAADQDATALSVDVEGAPQELNPALRDEIYQIAGEALGNAFRYAWARRIEIEIRYDTRQLRVRVRDDGIGVDAGVLSQEGRTRHWDLRGMRVRAKSLGAHLEVWSRRRARTEVEPTIPGSFAYGSPANRRSRLSRGKVEANS